MAVVALVVLSERATLTEEGTAVFLDQSCSLKLEKTSRIPFAGASETLVAAGERCPPL